MAVSGEGRRSEEQAKPAAPRESHSPRCDPRFGYSQRKNTTTEEGLSKEGRCVYDNGYVYVYDAWEVGSWHTSHVVLAKSPVGDANTLPSKSLGVLL